ncbi:MAG: GNAT family N-acetyltransferase, partial [Parabacteroides distasonis]
GDALDIIHTIVPKNLEGRGIAATLVETAYKYAKEQGLRPLATCSYAVVWLKRHPEF